MAAPDMDVIKDIPGYKVILKAVLKSQIQQLVEQLASTTNEESVILTASVADGTLSHLGSDSGKTFLEDHEDIKSQFLGFCLKRHHKRKQENLERERQEALEKDRLRHEAERQRHEAERQEVLARSVPLTPPRFGPRSGFMGARSPRFGSPRSAGPHPVSLSRVPPGSAGPRMRHEPYPMARPPRRSSLNFEQGRGPGPGSGPNPMGLPLGNKLDGQVIKIEPDDDEKEKSNQSAPGGLSSDGAQESSQPGSPSVNPSTPANNKNETSDKDDDAKSESSTSTIPNDASDLKLSDSVPPGGLSLDSDLSNLISGSSTVTSESVQDTSASGMDPDVSVKLEAMGDSEMDLEITGVELGQMPVGPGPDQMTSEQEWAQGMMASMGATGGPGDMAAGQQGYNFIPTVRKHISNFRQPSQPQEYARSENSRRSSSGDILGTECDVCGRLFNCNAQLKIHYRIHTGEKPYKCSHCDKAFAQKNNLKCHMISHIKEATTQHNY